MPLLKGNTNIIAIHKGATQIASIYKGTTLVFSSAKWLSYLFEKLYNSLIPTTIQSRNVLDKLKIHKVYGNSVVENQLVDFSTITSQTKNDVVLTNNNDGSFTLNGTASANTTFTFVSGTWGTNHYYLIYGLKNHGISGSVYWYDSYYNQFTSYQDFIYHPTNSSYTQRRITLFIKSGTQVNFTFTPQTKDLTQEYPFDTPTTLTDVRVQALLNRGYIEYNTGELKSVDISEFSSEPYNLFDEETELGAYDITTGAPTITSSQIRTKNDIEIIGGSSITCEIGSTGGLWGCLLDENKNIIPASEWSSGLGNAGNFKVLCESSGNHYVNTFNVPIEAKYIRFYFTAGYGTTYLDNVCIHLTGTRTGYAPHTQPHTLPFIYQGNGAGTSHDTFEITSSEYVFMKDMGSVDLGSLSWTSTTYGFSSQIANAKPDNTNSIAEKYMYSSNFRTEANTWGWATNYIGVNTTSTPTGKLIYELATPQVIRIPKKHLGIVDLGTLTWNYNSNYNYFEFWNYQNVIPHIYSCLPSTTNNAFCSKYMTASRDTLRTASSNNVLSIHTSDTDYITIKNTDYDNATQFKNAMSGIYLFYETESEVADIETQIQVEAGGTLTSDSNVLPDLMANIKCR